MATILNYFLCSDNDYFLLILGRRLWPPILHVTKKKIPRTVVVAFCQIEREKHFVLYYCSTGTTFIFYCMVAGVNMVQLLFALHFIQFVPYLLVCLNGACGSIVNMS